MANLQQWRRWSWEEIFTALSHERGVGEALEVPRELIDHPMTCGARLSRSGERRTWDYRFQADDGHNLYVRDLGDRYAAFLEEGGPLLSGPWAEERLGLTSPTLAAIAGGVLVFLGSVWAVLETMAMQAG